MSKRAWCLLFLLSLVGCNPAVEDRESDTGISVGRVLSTRVDPGFARVERVRQFEFPGDHGPHPEYATEWWYFTGNLRDEDQRRFGYQLTLFRVGMKPPPFETDSPWRSHQVYMGHLAVSDIEQQLHYSEERFSRAAAGLAGAEGSPLRVWLGPWSISGSPGGSFPLRLEAQGVELAIDLTLAQGKKPLVLQGDRGLSRKGAQAGNASYYYSHTRLPTQGKVRIDDQGFEVSGESWFDREWSSSVLDDSQAGWDWFALQLNDNRELMFYRMRGIDGRAQPFSSGILVDVDGGVERLTLDNTQLQVLSSWRNSDEIQYPIAWSLKIPHRQIDLEIRASFADQEMRHSVHYWEGAVEVSGSHNGLGYMELSGYAR